MIVFTIFRSNRNRTRYDNVDDLEIKNGSGIESELFMMCWEGGAHHKNESATCAPPGMCTPCMCTPHIWERIGCYDRFSLRCRVSLEKWIYDSLWSGKKPLGQQMVKMFGKIQHKLGVEGFKGGGFWWDWGSCFEMTKIVGWTEKMLMFERIKFET